MRLILLLCLLLAACESPTIQDFKVTCGDKEFRVKAMGFTPSNGGSYRFYSHGASVAQVPGTCIITNSGL